MGRAKHAALSIAVLVAVLQSGCEITTAHRLPLAYNPLRKQAEDCETECRANNLLNQQPENRRGYAGCLDSCPGATATDGSRCPDPPTTGLLCEETTRPNPSAIGAGTVAAIAVGAVIFILWSFATLADAVIPNR